MDEVLMESPGDSKKWIGRFLIAVILGEAIWGFLVSLTNNLVLPAMSRAIGADPQSPLYLGKGDFNIPPLFTSFLELCFAGIVTAILSSWSQRRVVVARAKPARLAPVAVPRPASIATVPSTPPSISNPPVAQMANAETDVVAQAKAQVAQVTNPEPASRAVEPTAQSAKPGKSKKAKPVYYNIVGEPIESDDE